jgi:predicted nucleic acid-binding protein
MNAVDTNVLVYAIDQHDPAKQVKALNLLARLRSAETNPTVIPWQVFGELMQQLRRWLDRGLICVADRDHYLRLFRVMFPLLLPTDAIINRSLDLTSRFSLSHWDSMLLGACLEAGVATLYTEDMGASRWIDTVELINPFA